MRCPGSSAILFQSGIFKSSMKTILHVIDSLGIGGAEKLLVGVINELKGYEQHLVILNGPETLLPEIVEDCRFSNLKVPNGWRGVWPAAMAIRKYIRDHKISIVHSHLYISNVSARLGTSSHVKLFNSIHAISSLCSYKMNRLSLYFERLTYKKRHRIISVSKEVEIDFAKYVGLKGPSAVLYNYIEEKFFSDIPKTNFEIKKLKLVAVGNLRHQKNYPYLLEAFRKLPASVSLDIYGEGSMRQELQVEIDKRKLNIKLCGMQNDLHKVLPQYDVFVMSSFYEGQPLSLLEAMACGLPTLLSDIPVLKEVTGDAAIYFSLSDTNSFVDRISEILERKHNLADLAAVAHLRVNSFAHKKHYMNTLIKLYEGL